MTETKYTFCRICEAGCGLKLTLDDNRIEKIEPDINHINSRGYACIKGLTLDKFIESPDRLTEPLKKVGDTFIAISWDQALEEIGDRLRSIHRQHGGQSIASYSGNPIGFTNGTTIANPATDVGINPEVTTKYGNAIDGGGQTLTFSVGPAGATIVPGPYAPGTIVLAGMTAATINALESHLLATGLFRRVNTHEPKNAPDTGLTAALIVSEINPSQSSGLASTSALVVYQARLYLGMLNEPQDGIDPTIMVAVDNHQFPKQNRRTAISVLAGKLAGPLCPQFVSIHVPRGNQHVLLVEKTDKHAFAVGDRST